MAREPRNLKVTPEQYFTAALDHMKNRIATPRTGAQLDERIGDEDLVRRISPGRARANDQHHQESKQQQPKEMCGGPPHQFAGATNGSL